MISRKPHSPTHTGSDLLFAIEQAIATEIHDIQYIKFKLFIFGRYLKIKSAYIQYNQIVGSHVSNTNTISHKRTTMQ